jgi:hypothetical protein
MASGRGWQFRYEPNIIRQIDEKKSDIPIEDAKSRVLSEAQGYFTGPVFKLTAWPANARQVPESTDLQLVLCENENIAKSACTYSDDSDPKAPLPRRFRNAIFAVTATETALSNAIDRAQRLMAAEAIEREHKTGESAKLVRDQLQRVKPELQKQSRLQSCRAFDRIVFPGGTVAPIEEKYQVPEEHILQKAQGQKCVSEFLTQKKQIYEPGDSLDVDLFMKEVLPGSTPIPDRPQVFTAKAVHERFLSAPGLRLVPDGGVVRQTILKALGKGKLVVRLPNGNAYDSKGCVTGPEGKRRRMPDPLTTLSLSADVEITRADSAFSKQWLTEDTIKKPSTPGETPEPRPDFLPQPPPPSTQVEAVNWEQILNYAAERPLLHLRLVARKPADAAQLMTLAQPLGAETLSLSVSASGNLKDGGNVNFLANDLKPTHPLKPLTVGQTIFNAVGEGCSYETTLQLEFGSGRSDMQDTLEKLSKATADSINVQATFDKPEKGNA